MSSRRRPKFTNRFTEARRAVVQRLVWLRDWFRPTTLFVICFTILSLLTALLLAQIHTQLRAQVYSEGDVVRAGVVSPADITAVDERATQAARAVLPNAPPTLVTLKRNQVVARAGDTVTPKMLAQFDAISKYGDTGRRPQHFIGIFLLVAALYLGAWKFIEHRSLTSPLALSKGRAFTLVASAILIQTILMRVGAILAETIAAQSVVAPWNDASLWSLAIPFAVATLLVALLLMDGQLALTAGIITALFAGLVSPNGVLIACYAMVSSSAAIYGIGRYSERQSVTLAGLFVAAVNSAAALAVILAAQEPLTLGTILMAIGCGVLGGLFTTIFTAGTLPVSESVFGILTDVKLLELSNADLPVLGQLALRAPGTNQHSHAVGQLTEEACRSIGANALLARIGALYHDIGKLAAPDMFVENQTGTNPHDRLRPSSSAKIITSHVTYGLKLAKEIGLPAKIAAFIPQHHGTRTLHYFLRKAQAQAIHGDQVNEEDFRYPGPRPQFKESAIMMLADSCEAAARSLARPDPENIRSIVSKIFDAIVSDGQLDECDLSLRELTTIKESMISSLVAIYHARIDYPGFNPPAPTGALTQLPQADLDTEERGIGYRTSEVPISKGGEVEDEAITRK
ncbi:MAG TPA: HDIG domain-containing protein [Pyrinomonadaceae bacterium]|nr:HDIG domain-containing protein [Pyrinomonadaceae bacterium]